MDKQERIGIINHTLNLMADERQLATREAEISLRQSFIQQTKGLSFNSKEYKQLKAKLEQDITNISQKLLEITQERAAPLREELMRLQQ